MWQIATGEWESRRQKGKSWAPVDQAMGIKKGRPDGLPFPKIVAYL